MPHHLTQEQRNTYVDTTRQAAREVLMIPEVQERLGHYASELFGMANSISPVDVDAGGYIDMNSQRTEQIPVAVLRAGEQAVRLASTDPFDVHQSRTLIQAYGQEGARAMAAAYTRLSGMRPSQLHTFNTELGYVSSDSVRFDDGKRVMNRPLLALNYDRSDGSHAAAPLLFHELRHVQQRRRMPVWDPRSIDFTMQDITDELEGYSVAAMTILGLQKADQQQVYLRTIPRESIDNALEIEEIRSRTNRYETDPFAASKHLASELVKNGHGITPYLKKEVAKRNNQ